MIRQRVHVRRLGLPELVLRLLVTVLGLAGIFYGAMVLLAALKLSPTTVNHISAYRTIDRTLSQITARSITGTDRIIIAAAGLACLFMFAPLAWRALPRPYLARSRMLLDERSGPGSTEIGPRALERAAEIAARRAPLVTDARARTDSGRVDVAVEFAGLDGRVLEPLSEVRRRVRDSLTEQGFPPVAVDVTLTGASLKPSAEKES